VSDIALQLKNYTTMARKSFKTIECRFSNNLVIKLENVHEVYGHDDSLPFNADVFVLNPEMGLPCLTKVAQAWNGGWGGPTCVQAHLPKYREIVEQLNNFLKEHYKSVYGEYSWDYSLDNLVEELACIAVDGTANLVNIKQLAVAK
jgi:hypothetical protein